MARRRVLLISLAPVLLLVLTVGLLYAQGANPQAGPSGNAGGHPQAPLGPQAQLGAGPSAPLGTSFTYQGQLKGSGGAPIDDICDFTFGLWDDASTGSQVGSDSMVSGVVVTNGYFAALVNSGGEFGAGAFAGEERWLEIAVQCPADPAPVTLSPRQLLSAAPYAVYSTGAPWSGLTGVPDLQLRVSGTCASGNAIRVVNADGSVTCEPVGGGGAHDHWGESWSGSGTGLVLSGGGIGLSGEGTQYGVYGQSSTTNGVGVAGWASATSGTTSGVWGQSSSPDGLGVYGSASATTGVNYGLFGRSASPDGRGVFGFAVATSGTNYGVRGVTQSPDGTGVFGWASTTNGTNYGVYGRTSSSSGYGVFGTGGNGSYGVYGYNSGTDTGLGVYGRKEGGGSGVSGLNWGDGNGTWGFSADYKGVAGETGRADDNYGLYTQDNLYSLNFHTLGATMHVVQNGDAAALERGDLVEVAGLGEPLAAGTPPIIRVRKARTAESTAIIGVVDSSYSEAWLISAPLDPTGSTGPDEVAPLSGSGPIAPGDYLLIVVQGPAQVKVDAAAGPIAAGDLLVSTALAGHAAGTRTAAPGTVLGKALEAAQPGQGLVYVYVTLR